MLAVVNISGEVPGNDGHSGLSGDAKTSSCVLGSPIVAFGN